MLNEEFFDLSKDKVAKRYAPHFNADQQMKLFTFKYVCYDREEL